MASEPVLNQDEVDALLTGMSEGRVSTDGAVARGEVRRYELGHEARVVRGRVLLISCLDNLVKGAAGAAVQNFNVLFNLPETAGLL
jgi:N-acetyl-gamma-glutamylphosphate reductase